VTGYHKRSIEDHFDAPSRELVENLRMGGEKKRHLLEQTEKISELANFIYVRQKGPYGNGTPLMNVRALIGDEPFIYTWSDDFIEADTNEYKELMSVYDKYQASVLSSIKLTNDNDYKRFGIAGGKEVEPGLLDVDVLIEKPGKENAPSDLGNVSSTLFTPDVFNYLDQVSRNLKEGDELYYNDALKLMISDGKKVMAKEIPDAKHYDTGNKVGYLKAVVDFALEHKELNGEFIDYLKSLKL
jgi:UTP--glucose-1-phosphate uridylyltransferase